MSSIQGDPWQIRLEQLAQELFAFLVKEKGFVQRRSKRSAFATSLYYVHGGGQLGVEIQLDYRDGTVDLYLLKLQAGKLPEDGLVVKGERVRRSLDLLLRDDLHIQDEQLDALFALYRTPGRWSEQIYAEALQAASAVVERFTDLVLQQPLEVLFPPRGKPRSS